MVFGLCLQVASSVVFFSRHRNYQVDSIAVRNRTHVKTGVTWIWGRTNGRPDASPIFLSSSYVFFVKRLVFEEPTKQNSSDTNDQNILEYEFRGVYIYPYIYIYTCMSITTSFHQHCSFFGRAYIYIYSEIPRHNTAFSRSKDAYKWFMYGRRFLATRAPPFCLHGKNPGGKSSHQNTL